MTSHSVWFFLFILLDTSLDQTRSMHFHSVLLPSGDSDMDRPTRNRRSAERSLDSMRLKSVDGVIGGNQSETENVTLAAHMAASPENATKLALVSPVQQDVYVVPRAVKQCNPCVLWKPPSNDDRAYHPNLTIIPMGGIFTFIAYLCIKCIHWCNEDIRLADERFMKISVPNFDTPTGSPQITHVKHHPNFRGVHHHRRSSVSTIHVKYMHKGRRGGIDDTAKTNTDDTLSEDTTVIYNDGPQQPLPAAACNIGKSMSQKMGYCRSPNRYLRRQSLHSSNTTLSSSFSSRSPSIRTRNISFHDSKGECSSPSSLGHGNADSYLDVTPLIRHHSTSSDTPHFSQRKLAFHTHLLTPPLLHFQVSSVDTSTTSLGESIPSLTSKPSMCDSALTEHFSISEDGESSHDDSSSKGVCSSSQPIELSSHHKERPHSGMMFLSGSYYEDPLIIECSYMEVDGTEPTIFTVGSRSTSPQSMKGEVEVHIPQIHDDDHEDSNCLEEEDDTDKGPCRNEDTHIVLDDGSDISECNSESGLTEGHEAEEEINKGSETTSYCSSPGIYHGRDPSLYYKLSVESNASTGSLQSPDSIQSDATSLCSSEMALVRRVNPSVALRWLNHKSHPPRRERISLNGVTYFSQHGGRRIQNGKVMRMCRSWCLGDKPSAIYGQLRRGLSEKECYM